MKSQEKYTVIKKFDIEGFMKKGGGDIDFTDRDGILVRQWSGEDELEGTYYIDERHYPNSPYLYYCEYDKYGRIKISLTNFYSTFIGKITYYDTSGNIVNETDEDAPYKFSIDDLILKMRREYNIDIEDKKKIWGVYRYVVDNGVFYDVRVRAPYSKNIVYLINGDNGKTLYITETETEWYPGRSEETVYEEYKRDGAHDNHMEVAVGYNQEEYITMKTIRLFCVISTLLILLSCRGASSKRTQREYNIDIEDKKKIWTVDRYVMDNGVFYDVRVRAPYSKNIVYLINGDNGKTLAPYSKNIVYLINGDNGKTLYITESETEWYPG
ncbi:hypothetical protein QE152_g41226, partial [Popillia japonica]